MTGPDQRPRRTTAWLPRSFHRLRREASAWRFQLTVTGPLTPLVLILLTIPWLLGIDRIIGWMAAAVP